MTFADSDKPKVNYRVDLPDISKTKAGKVKFTRSQTLQIIGDQNSQYRNHPNNQVKCPCGLSRTITVGGGWLYQCYYCGIWFCKVCAADHFGDDTE